MSVDRLTVRCEGRHGRTTLADLIWHPLTDDAAGPQGWLLDTTSVLTVDPGVEVSPGGLPRYWQTESDRRAEHSGVDRDGRGVLVCPKCADRLVVTPKVVQAVDALAKHGQAQVALSTLRAAVDRLS